MSKQQERKQYPSRDRLRELFDYDPEGFLVWKSGKKAGEVIGFRSVEGSSTIRYRVTINGVKYKYNDILWIYFNGVIPSGKTVKSKSGPFLYAASKDLFLSDAKHSKNCGNITTKNIHGFKGVRRQRNGLFQALLDGSDLGTYETAEAAASAWDAAAVKKYGRGLTENNSGCKNPQDYRVLLAHRKHAKRNSKHKYKGAMPNRRKWMARIGINGKPKYLGTFETEEQAARAYNIAAYEHYGEKAVLNDIPDPLGRGDVF